MSLDKKIQETFNPPPSLDGEDWLLPSDDLFDAIEESVYAEPKRNRKALWFWFLPLALVVSLVAYLLIDHNGDHDESNVAKSAIELEERRVKSDKVDSKLVADNSDTISNAVGNINSNSNKPSNTINDQLKGQSFNNYVSQKAILPFSIQENVSNGFVENALNDLNESTVSDFIELKKDVSSNLRNNAGYLTGSTDRSLINLSGISALETKLVYGYNLENTSQVTPFGLRQEFIPSWILAVSTGLSNWNFDLNSNYVTALQPADFHFTRGQGYFVEIGLERSISSRFRLGGVLSLDRNVFESGHNSIIDYDRNNEGADKTNGFDLTMASPLGFLESNIVVARSVDAADNTNLTIDLDNSHTITNVDLGIYADVDLLTYKNISIGTQFGGGLNYLSSITNSLDHFSTSESGFNSHGSIILSDQSAINSLRPYYSIGLNLNYNCSPSTVIGVGHQYRQDANSIFQSGEFSTLVSRQLTGFYIKKKI